MTEQPRRLCCTCFRAYVPPGMYKCGDCDPGRAVPNRAAKCPTPNPLDLTGDLAGLNLADLGLTDPEMPQ
ncbi:hypothetical protein [Mycobacterium seoulense]|uniref:Uncharacterized protein n=1 Tax=Mycobacterium seoulense TaxID=386911 RepID=A0A7I7NXY8_9MYCO|nr:hypothetical protein [Mycobacterium seoulense]MCV7436075.1 hypothetical protein [Mycobacterium seoulense]BBY01044.1 hypothetical protein MSEO_15430 [Mycobacterium seoulense]